MRFLIIQTAFASFAAESLVGSTQAKCALALRPCFSLQGAVGGGRAMPTPVIVRSLGGNDACQLEVQSRTALRDLQFALCRHFGQPFPAMKATLVVGNRTFTEFEDKPFFSGETEATVVFVQTDDPYFYDLRDRRPGRMPR
jgi:hypothetical protein